MNIITIFILNIFDFFTKKKILKKLNEIFLNKKIDIFFDVGAYHGDVTFELIKNFEISKIYAFEPNEESFAKLKKKVDSKDSYKKNGEKMMEYLNWTKEEFKAFLLLYAAQTNFIETQEEIEYIESKFPNEIINRTRKEINKLNDYQKSEIIVNQIKSNEYVQSDLDEILLEIKELYKSDGVFDSLEQSMFSMLEKLLKVD